MPATIVYYSEDIDVNILIERLEERGITVVKDKAYVTLQLNSGTETPEGWKFKRPIINGKILDVKDGAEFKKEYGHLFDMKIQKHGRIDVVRIECYAHIPFETQWGENVGIIVGRNGEVFVLGGDAGIVNFRHAIEESFPEAVGISNVHRFEIPEVVQSIEEQLNANKVIVQSSVTHTEHRKEGDRNFVYIHGNSRIEGEYGSQNA